MKNIIEILQHQTAQAVKELYGAEFSAAGIPVNITRKEFEGDYTIVVFPFTKVAKKNPEAIGAELGQYLERTTPEISGFNVIKGFLNVVVSNQYWNTFLKEALEKNDYGYRKPDMQSSRGKVMVEFSSPNTNKPLHLGHIRNILLGWSCYKILTAAGYEVIRVQIVNDRGISICKSMVAWQRFGNGATPQSAGLKGDHFVGNYYVRFEKEFQKEYLEWQQSPEAKEVFRQREDPAQSESGFFKAFKNEYFNQYSKLGQEAKTMLLKWEANDPEIRSLWSMMNSWVYEGFEETYQRLGVSFDKLYYESNTYLLGKDTIEKGLKEDIFYRKEDGSVWIDLTEANLDHKIVLRSDGTSVYITQDLGTAQLRYRDFGVDKMVYVVADEQNYHFQVLFEILKRLGAPYAQGLYHLAYGMVDLPSGKMKSREGTIVDADDLIAEVIEEARENAKERGKIADLPEEEQEEILKMIGLAALKFFIIKVFPKKRMTFDPKESVDMQGQTGPYIQNAYVRTRSVLRKAEEQPLSGNMGGYLGLNPQEKEIVVQLFAFPDTIELAARDFDPSIIANFCYNLARSYHRFYNDFSILNAETEDARVFRLKLSEMTGNVLKTGMDLLGIEMPEKM